jgi:hypothetical protein
LNFSTIYLLTGKNVKIGVARAMVIGILRISDVLTRSFKKLNATCKRLSERRMKTEFWTFG